MTDLMTHRGPDERGTHQEEGVALGVRRLSIIDVEAGQQPVSNEIRSVWAIQNGELYNHEEVRADLIVDGHVLQTRCDTEVLPHLYERWGDDYAAHLRGDFATAVWDREQRRAVLARDRAGVKPLYYAVVDDVVVFASELKSLLGSGLVATRVDPEGVYLFLTFGYVPGPRTLLQGVSKLLPGERLTIGDGAVTTTDYWTHPKPEVGERLSAEEYGRRLMAELDESVRVRLMSEVPLGAMLSGGLDSSIVVALMARASTLPVKTYSVGFLESADANELDDARLVASYFGTEHHELELSFERDTVDLEDLLWHLDEPVADVSTIGFYALSKFASTSVTVALSGQGADELLGGYKKHRAAALAGSWRHLGRTGRAAASLAARVAPGNTRRPARTLAAANPVERHLAMSGRLDPGLRTALLAGRLSGADDRIALEAVGRFAAGLADDPLPASMYLDGRLALPDALLHYFDHMSMAHSLEVRVPFLDHHVVELCAKIPSDVKVRRLTTKHILKEAARGLVPDQVIDKRKVGFFRHAADGWIRAQLTRAAPHYLLNTPLASAEFLNQASVLELVDQHRRGRSPHSELLLAVLMLEVWLTSYLPRALERPSLTGAARGGAHR
jgi:asparagine synthase (glutamine-hydrolysing)